MRVLWSHLTLIRSTYDVDGKYRRLTYPSSYMVVPTGITTAPMRGSTKKWIKWLRIVQLVLRALCLIGALGLLVVMIILRGMDDSIGWLMRIAVSIYPQCGLPPANECSPELQLSIPYTEYIISLAKLVDERPPHRHHTCFSPRSSTYRLFPATHSAP